MVIAPKSIVCWTILTHLRYDLRYPRGKGRRLAWRLSQDYSYAGPGFDWINPDSVVERRCLFGGGLSLSQEINPENVPIAARYREKYDQPPAVDIFFVASSVAVTGRFKRLVEQYEPGIHLFVPIALQFHDGTVMPGEYYFFNANVSIDCVLTDNKEEWFYTTKFGDVKPAIRQIQRSSPIDIRLSAPAIRDVHLWTGGVLGWNELFVSDAFAKALHDGKFRAVEFRKECVEIDRPWVADENIGPLRDKWEAFEGSGHQLHAGWM